MADTFVERIYLNDDHTLWADVYQNDDTIADLAEQAADLITEIEERGYFEPGFDLDNPSHFPDLPDDFDIFNPNTRGPFIDDQAVQFWLDDSGLRDQVAVYYDEEHDEFWIDADTNSGDA